MKRLALVAVFCIPVAVWAFYKPVRVVTPNLMGLSCMNDAICTDAPSRLAEAAGLYTAALKYVEASIGSVEAQPRVVFCSTIECGERFGLGNRSALTLGTLGSVIGADAWKPYYVRHEMIHYVQSERLGMLKAWREPKWFSEGMAYALSGDPRSRLKEPFEQYRTEFLQWYGTVGKQRLWQAAQNL